MTLVLTLDGPASRAAKLNSFRLEFGRVTIGRSSDCDWPLPDPERTLSRQHCIVEERAGRYFLTDTSANGVFVDGSGRPVGRDNTVEIHSGVRLELGDFSISVAIDAGLERPGPSRPVASAPKLDRSNEMPNFDDIFGDPALSSKQARSGGNASSLLDESFVQQRPLRQAEHPVERPVEKAATPHDHTPVEFEALDWAKPKRAEPQDPPVTPSGPFFDQSEAIETTPPRPIERPQRTAEADDFLAQFLEAAGIDKRLIEEQSDAETARQLGEAFAALAGGLAALLRNRAMIKREAGVEQTMITSAANNPLKFALNDQDAVEALVRHRGQGYLEPIAAVREGIKDIERHELAVLDGMQAALTSLLRRFEPERLEKELADSSRLAALIAGGRKAQYWELFKSRYGEIAASARQRFMGELGEDFAGAYRDRTRKRK
ncbi:MAG: type VI secretion system-associated FHA domain protein TagH [Pseudomonadota bacterium]